MCDIYEKKIGLERNGDELKNAVAIKYAHQYFLWSIWIFEREKELNYLKMKIEK